MGVQRTMGDGGSPAHTYQGEFVRDSVLRHDMGEVAVELVDEKPKEDRVARGTARVSEGRVVPPRAVRGLARPYPKIKGEKYDASCCLTLGA